MKYFCGTRSDPRRRARFTFVLSNAQESPSPAEEQPSISPDKKWGYIGGDTPKLVKLSTDETVIDFFEQLNPGTAPAGQDPELLWAPDSKRFGFNYSPMHAHHMTFQSIVFYQLRGDKWVALDSPADETRAGSESGSIVHRGRGLGGKRFARAGGGVPVHFEVRRRRQLEDHQNASDVEKGARRRTMRSFITFVAIVACTIRCCFSNAQKILIERKTP